MSELSVNDFLKELDQNEIIIKQFQENKPETPDEFLKFAEKLGFHFTADEFIKCFSKAGTIPLSDEALDLVSAGVSSASSNSQFINSVTQENQVSSPAEALGRIYQDLTQQIGIAMYDTISTQQQLYVTMQTAAMSGVVTLDGFFALEK
jgi:Nitrogen fixation protein of unknown function./Killing trait.